MEYRTGRWTLHQAGTGSCGRPTVPKDNTLALVPVKPKQLKNLSIDGDSVVLHGRLNANPLGMPKFERIIVASAKFLFES